MASQWYVKSNGQEFGPFSSSKLKALAQHGKIGRTAFVRKGANGTWVGAARVQGLFQETVVPSNAAPNKKETLAKEEISKPLEEDAVAWIGAPEGPTPESRPVSMESSPWSEADTSRKNVSTPTMRAMSDDDVQGFPKWLIAGIGAAGVSGIVIVALIINSFDNAAEERRIAALNDQVTALVDKAGTEVESDNLEGARELAEQALQVADATNHESARAILARVEAEQSALADEERRERERQAEAESERQEQFRRQALIDAENEREAAEQRTRVSEQNPGIELDDAEKVDRLSDLNAKGYYVEKSIREENLITWIGKKGDEGNKTGLWVGVDGDDLRYTEEYRLGQLHGVGALFKNFKPVYITEIQNGKTHGWGWNLPTNGKRGFAFKFAYGKILNATKSFPTPGDYDGARLISTVEGHMEHAFSFAIPNLMFVGEVSRDVVDRVRKLEDKR